MSEQHEHFSSAGGIPTGSGRYVDVSAISPAEFAPGLKFRPGLGERTMVNFVSFEEHTEAPHHAHEEEQVVIVLEGEFEFELDGQVRTMRQGDAAVIPPWVPHGAQTNGTRCLEDDVFNPPRQTLLDHARGQVAASARPKSPADQL